MVNEFCAVPFVIGFGKTHFSVYPVLLDFVQCPRLFFTESNQDHLKLDMADVNPTVSIQIKQLPIKWQ